MSPQIIIAVLIAIGIIFCTTLSYKGKKAKDKWESKIIEAQQIGKTGDPLLAELRALRFETIQNRDQLEKIKWAIRLVGITIIGISLGLIGRF